MSDTSTVDDDLRVPSGIVYNRPPAHKRRPVPSAEPKTPTLLRDISGSGAGSAPSRSSKRKGTLTKISEAAEWADESTRADSNLDAELEAVWAEAGMSGAGGADESNVARGAVAGMSTSSSKSVGASSADGAKVSQQKDTISSSPLLQHADDSSEEEDAFQVEIMDSSSPVAAAPSTTAKDAAGSRAAETTVTKLGAASDSESSEEASSDEGEAVAALPTPARTRAPENAATQGANGAASAMEQVTASKGSAAAKSDAGSKTIAAEVTTSTGASDAASDMEFLDLEVDDLSFANQKADAGSLQSAAPAADYSHFEDFSPEKVRPSVAKEVPAQPQSKPNLIDMMTSAVQSVEQESNHVKTAATSSPGPVGAGSSSAADVPEVAGLDLEIDDTDVAKFSHGSTAALLSRKDGLTTNAVAGRKPVGRIVGRTDAFEEAIKKSTASTPAASTAPALGSVGLSGLRKNFAAGAAAAATSSTAPAGPVGSTSSTAPAQPTGATSSTTESASRQAETHPAAQTVGSAAAQSSLADVKTIATTHVDSQATQENADDDDAALLDEWDEIGRKTEEFAAAERANKGVVKAQQDLLSQPIAYTEVHQWLLKVDVKPDVLLPLREEEAEDTRCGCMSRRRSLTDVPGLDRRLAAEKDLVLFLKMTHFDFNDTTHHRMLRTIYTKLARAKVCPTVGRHWEVLGFQGGDPKTDLNRSCGVLNVLQMFFFFSHHFDLLKNAYLLAQDSEQNFPLACVGINITRMVIDCLLRGRLSKLCNASEKGVFDTVCTVYCGGLFHFYHRWRTQKRTIRHTELTFNEVRELMEKRPAKLIEGLHKGAREHKSKSDASRLEFTDLDFSGRAPQAAKAGSSGGSGAALIPKRLRNYADGNDGGG